MFDRKCKAVKSCRVSPGLLEDRINEAIYSMPSYRCKGKANGRTWMEWVCLGKVEQFEALESHVSRNIDHRKRDSDLIGNLIREF